MVADQAERARRIAQAVHSNRMSGLDVTPETLADAQEYIEGRITSRELRRRVHARYGVPDTGEPAEPVEDGDACGGSVKDSPDS